MKGKRRVKNKAEMSRKGGKGRQELMVLKLDGEWGQGELIHALLLDEIPTEAPVKSGQGKRRAGVQIAEQGRGRGQVSLQHPKSSERISSAPRGASPAALGTHLPV